MKPKRVLLFTTTVVLILWAACGMWLHKERQQYARNRRLIIALTHNDTKTALALVNAGADPNTRYSPTPAPTLLQLLQQLLHHTPPPANDSPTAFIIACGFDWNQMNDRPDMATILDENPSLLQAMLKHGADVHARTLDDLTALHFAVFMDQLYTVNLLLQHGAEVNAQNNDGGTPLMWATSNYTANAVHLLFSYGANPNVQDTRGNTALHNAVVVADWDNVIPELMAHGADPSVKNKVGDTPLQYAQKIGYTNRVHLLKDGPK